MRFSCDFSFLTPVHLLKESAAGDRRSATVDRPDIFAIG
jgi:hypothetical protein